MATWKKLEEEAEHFDKKKLITTRVTLVKKVHQKEEDMGREDVKGFNPATLYDTKAKKIFIGCCVISAIIYIMSVLL